MNILRITVKSQLTCPSIYRCRKLRISTRGVVYVCVYGENDIKEREREKINVQALSHNHGHEGVAMRRYHKF